MALSSEAGGDAEVTNNVGCVAIETDVNPDIKLQLRVRQPGQGYIVAVLPHRAGWIEI